MAESLIVTTPSDGVRLLEINRPERRNALDMETYVALTAALRDADADPGVRAVVLAGTQGVFTAGADLADFRAGPRDGARPALVFLETLVACGTPLVAGVEGFAVGIGTTMLLHCDLAYAGRSARMRMPFVPLGMCPEGASSLLLPQVAGPKAAAELPLLGEEFSGETAARHGIVNEAVADGTAVARALDRAAALAKLSRDAVRTSKALLRQAQREATVETIRREGVEFERLRMGPEAQASFARFFEKKKG